MATESNRELFLSRISKSRPFLGLDSESLDVCICICVGALSSDSPENQKSVALNTHFLGSAAQRTLIVLSSTEMYLFSESETDTMDLHKDYFLMDDGNPTPNVHWQPVSDSDASPTLETTLSKFSKVGYIKKELTYQEGYLALAFSQFVNHHLKAQEVQNSDAIEVTVTIEDVAAKVSEVLVRKDTKAVDAMRKAGSFASVITKSMIFPRLDEILSNDVEIPMSEFALQIEDCIRHPNKISGLESLMAKNYGIAIEPAVIKGGGGPLKLIYDDPISDKPIAPGIIISAYGVRYMGYVGYIARSFLYNTTKAQQDAYSSLLALMDWLTNAMRVGETVKNIYSKTRTWYVDAYPNLHSYLGRSFGFGIGLEIMASSMALTERNSRILESGMTFAIRLVLEDVVNEGKKFSLLLADMVHVRAEEDSVEVLTQRAPSDLRDVVRQIGDDSSSESEAGEEPAPEGIALRLRNSGRNSGAALQQETLRKEQQRKIMEQRRRDAEEQQGQQVKKEEKDFTEIAKLAKGDLKPLTNANESYLSSFASRYGCGIHIDQSRELILLPGLINPHTLTPIHLSMIRTVESKAEGSDFTLLRLQFHALQDTNAAYRCNKNSTFLREISYRIKKGVEAGNIAREIKTIQTLIKQRETARKAQGDVIDQQGLVMSRTLDKILKDVKCYPNPRVSSTGRSTGVPIAGHLEVHVNGTRYVQRDSNPLIILFNNVKTCIFQPSENDPKVLLHFHLKQPIQVGKRKTVDVQFYLDVSDESDVAHYGHTRWEDEVEQEEHERQRISRLNSEFLHFSKKLETALQRRVETPLRKFHFFGTHDKAMVKFKGSERTLFSLCEAPVFVQVMQDVQIAVFERVTDMKRSFDVTFIRNNYTTVTINNIEFKLLDKVKDWLNEAKVKYYEMGVNLMWKSILGDIKDDPEWDPWGHEGWDYILNDDGDGSDDDSDEGMDSDSEYVYSEDDSDTSDDSIDSKLVSEESSEYEPSSEATEDSEEGMDWDDLERRAASEDRQRGNESDDSRRAKKRSREKDRSVRSGKNKGPSR